MAPHLSERCSACLLIRIHCLQVGQKQSSMRQLQVGGTYSLPPPARGLLPTAGQPLTEWRSAVNGAAQQVLITLPPLSDSCLP